MDDPQVVSRVEQSVLTKAASLRILSSTAWPTGANARSGIETRAESDCRWLRHRFWSLLCITTYLWHDACPGKYSRATTGRDRTVFGHRSNDRPQGRRAHSIRQPLRCRSLVGSLFGIVRLVYSSDRPRASTRGAGEHGRSTPELPDRLFVLYPIVRPLGWLARRWR